MLILIVIIAFLTGLLFLTAAIALGGFIYNAIKKNEDLKKKCLKVLIPSTVFWFLLIMVNTVLVFAYLYINRWVIINFIRDLINLVH